jgi:hypothetical protein
MTTPTILAVLSIAPGNVVVFLAVLFLVAGGLVWYALRTKGDVRAEVSHGRTLFKLEAKERRRK